MCLGGKPLSILESDNGSGARSGRANYRRASNPINWGHPAEGSLVGNRFSRGHGARLADSMRQWSICSSMLRQSLFFSFGSGKDTDLPGIRSRSMFPPSGTVFIQNWSGEKSVCRFIPS